MRNKARGAGRFYALDPTVALGNAGAGRFFSWIDEGDVPVLVISGTIDTGTSWYDDAVTPRAFREALDKYAGRDIIVSINSPGGDVFAGFEIYNMLAQRSGGTTVRVTGLAASAASYIAMAADPGKLHMCRASMLMIHNPWTSACGDADALRKNAEVLDEIGSVMEDIYMQRATCTREELHGMLCAQRYLSPTEALSYGLCDAVVDPFEEDEDAESATAAAMLGRYAALSPGDVRQMRAGLAIKPPHARGKAPAPEATPAAPQDTTDYLAMADALLAGMR